MTIRALVVFVVLVLLASPLSAQVAFDAASESHTGATGSTSEASFSWTHTPSGTPKGVAVITMTNANADDITSITYGGTSMSDTTCTSNDTSGEAGNTQVWFLGSSVPTGAQSVVVTRTNNADEIYAASISVTATGDTSTTGCVTVNEGFGATSESNVDDSSPGSNSLRIAGITSGYSAGPTPGANSTLAIAIDYGSRTSATVYETTAGQGSRPVGFAEAVNDDRAISHIAITDTGGGGGSPLRRRRD